jgi:hypothetical protein
MYVTWDIILAILAVIAIIICVCLSKRTVSSNNSSPANNKPKDNADNEITTELASEDEDNKDVDVVPDISHKHYVSLVGIDSKIDPEINNVIGCNSASTKITWMYGGLAEHDAYYAIHNIRGVWAETKKGIVVVHQNGLDTIYNYTAAYDKKRRKLMLSIIDHKREILKLDGDIKIDLTFCAGSDCCEKSSDHYWEVKPPPTRENWATYYDEDTKKKCKQHHMCR